MNLSRVTAVAALVVLAAEEGELVREALAVRVALEDALPRGHHVHGRDNVAGPAGALVDRRPEEVLAVFVAPVEVLCLF